MLRNGYDNSKVECNTVGPILIVWSNYCVLSFASKIVNLSIVIASHEARKVYYK